MAEIISICASSSVPISVSEMFQNEKIPNKLYDNGLLIYTIRSNERIIRYGKRNKFEHDAEPVTTKSDRERIINLYIGTPEDIPA